MGNISSVVDCAVNPLHSVDDEGDEFADLKVIENAVPLRDSRIWQLQHEFYDTAGARAWTDSVVPLFATSNSFIAKAYAKMIFGVLRDVFTTDMLADASRFEPVYIVEVGAGHGKLGYLIVEALLRLRAFLPQGPADALPFKYILTDRSASCVTAMREHPSIRQFIEQGAIDVAVWDAEAGGPLLLQESGAQLAPGTLRHPVVAVCNYLFNSLKQDAFRFRAGMTEQALVSVLLPSSAKPADAVPRMQVRWKYAQVERAGRRPVAQIGAQQTTETGAASHPNESQQTVDPYADDPTLAGIVDAYSKSAVITEGASSSILIPIGAIAAIKHLRAFAAEKLVVLCSDKGNLTLDSLKGAKDPHIAVHGVSTPV
jgi:hypothetical protein